MGGHPVKGSFQKLVVDIPCGEILTVFGTFCLVFLLTHIGYHRLLIGCYQIAEVIPEIR